MRFHGNRNSVNQCGCVSLFWGQLLLHFTPTPIVTESWMLIKLVELGIGILRADPKDTGLTAARGWAFAGDRGKLTNQVQR